MTAESVQQFTARCPTCGADATWTATNGAVPRIACPACDRPVPAPTAPVGSWRFLRTLGVFLIPLIVIRHAAERSI